MGAWRAPDFDVAAASDVPALIPIGRSARVALGAARALSFLQRSSAPPCNVIRVEARAPPSAPLAQLVGEVATPETLNPFKYWEIWSGRRDSNPRPQPWQGW